MYYEHTIIFAATPTEFVDWCANAQGFQSAMPPSIPAYNLDRPTAILRNTDVTRLYCDIHHRYRYLSIYQ